MYPGRAAVPCPVAAQKSANLQLIEKKSGTFDPNKFEDHYGTALKKLVQEKLKGHTVIAKEAERPAGGNVVDLMEALKRSIEGAAPARRRHAGRRSSPESRSLMRDAAPSWSSKSPAAASCS
jgi:DNA end-binding protein Ku